MAQLIISLNNQIIKKLDLTEDSYVIGRASQCDIVLNDRTVSTEHAHLVTTGDDCFLEDLHSTNGVYINGIAAKKHLLLDKDLITIGKYEIRYHKPTTLKMQLHQLSIHPRLSDQIAGFAFLEIIGGKKNGYLISLKKQQINFDDAIDGASSTSVECNSAGDYILNTKDANQSKKSYKLSANDIFEVGDVKLKFHEAVKLAKL